MKKISFYLFALLFSTSLFIASCNGGGGEPKEDYVDTTEATAEINEFELLVNYLEENGDFINTDAPAMIKSSEVNEKGENYYIIDLRGATDFANGHIKGAVNVPMGKVLDHIKSVNLADFEKVVMVCYTGQSASFTTCALRLLGHNNVFAMKWGMCGWNKDIKPAKWTKNGSNKYGEQLETTANEMAAAGDYPTLNTGKTTGKEILEARIEELMSKPFSDYRVKADELFGNGANYYIINYWPVEKYNVGHVPGAIQYTPKKSFRTDAVLNTLPTDKTIVPYCYTGQHSAFVTAYLNILGYDVKSLLFGANSFMNEVMKTNEMGHIFSDKQIHDYPYETSEVPQDAEVEEGGGC